MIGALYWYKGLCTAVYDGDTITLNLNLGFNFRVNNFKIRMLGINAPEVVGANRAAGLASRDFLASRVLDRMVMLHSYKDRADKYGGRWLGEIYHDGVNVNQLMIESGHAVPYMERA